jgi:hypothetical protein
VKKRYYRFVCRSFLAVTVILISTSVKAAANDVSVTAEQWSRISSPKAFMAIGGLRDLVTDFNQQTASTLQIHYQGGENGLLWAQQFRNRLVALGIESSRIQLVQGATKNNTLVIGLQENP